MAGKTLAHYEIVELIGKGGMGEVYLARDTRLGRDVALKVLPADAAHDTELRDRLEQEARSVAALHHPNIVTLFSVEDDEGRLFLTMELVRGPTLSEVIGNGLAIGRLLELALPLTDAIGAAHDKGIVHRDLKPSNIMLDESGRVKVLDFGLAKQAPLAGPTDETAKGTDLTAEGTILGTYSYLSPEQAQGQPVDARSDVFALGIILYEMATGLRPFAGDNPISVLSSIIKDMPAPSPNMEPRLARIIGRCLEKDPGRRYAGAAELFHDLATLERELNSGAATPAPAAAPHPKRRVLVPAILVAVVAALGFLGWRLLTPKPRSPAPPTVAPMTNVVVVFPFENLGRAEDAYFAEGMTDEIVSRLTSVPGIGVIARTTAINYPRRGKTLDQIGKDLGVDFVLEGTIRWDRREGTDRVRVTPQLVRVADGTNAWASSYDRDLDDVFTIQSDIASQVVTSIDASLVARDRLRSPRTTNLEAYDYFLKAGEYTHWGTAPPKSRLDRAAALLDTALALDPEFAPALAQLSLVHSSAYFLQYDTSEERLRLAKQTAGEAVRLQPDLGEGHLALGLYYYRSNRDYTRALEELQVARQLAPGNGEILSWIGTLRKRQGRYEEALEILGRANRLDPRNVTTLGEMCIVYEALRDFDNALRWADRLVDVDPSLRNQIFRARIFMYRDGDTAPWRAVLEAAESPDGLRWARLLAMEHRFDEALSALDSTRTESTDTWAVANNWLLRARLLRWNGRSRLSQGAAAQAVAVLEGLIHQDRFANATLALAYAYQGRSDEAVAQIGRARELLPPSYDALDAVAVVAMAAEVYTVLGDTASAVSLLDEALRTRGGARPRVVEFDPAWDPIRDTVEFQKMLDRHR